MVPGHQALSSIEEALTDIRQDERRVSDRLESINSKISDLRTSQAKAYRDLANFRMSEDPDGIADRIDRAGRLAADLLDDRKQQTLVRRRKIDELEKRAADLREARATQSAKLIDASEAHASAEEDLREKLAEDSNWTEKKKTLDHAVEVAKSARAKTDTAEKDRDEKGQPYRDDILFMYLWNRKFGLSEYTTRGIVKRLDQWVAGLIDYQHARPNYAMLLEIPQRLDEHADRLEADVADAQEALRAIEDDAFAGAETAKTAERVKKLRDELADVDRQISVSDAELEQLVVDEEKSANQDDEQWTQASKLLVESLQSDNLQRLHREALQTPSPEDERIIERIEDINKSIDRLEAETEDDRLEMRRLSKKREELSQMTHDFRDRGWADSGSVFGDNALTGVVLGEFLRGAITAADYWSRMEGGHTWRRSRNSPDFGGGIDMGRDWSGGWSGGGGMGGGGMGGGFGDSGGFGGDDAFGGDFHMDDSF